MTERARVDGVEAELLRFVAEDAAADGAGLHPDENFVATGRIDSLGLLRILAFVEERYGVSLAATAHPRDLQSVSALAAAVRRERLAGAEAG
jgi:acyl carrier protein